MQFNFLEISSNSITEIDESGETVAKEIMGEILEKALKQIHERYMDQQLIKFVVHCSHQALMKALRIHFYQHNDYIRNSLFWGSEKRPEPSYPDSWALDQVPVSKNMCEEEELNTLSRTKLEMGLKGAEIVVDSTVDLSSEPSETLLEDIKEMINDIINNLPVKYEETPEVGISPLKNTILIFSFVYRKLNLLSVLLLWWLKANNPTLILK